jgi:hypothetical protein
VDLVTTDPHLFFGFFSIQGDIIMAHHAFIFNVTPFIDGPEAIIEFLGLAALDNPALTGAGYKPGKFAVGRTEHALWAIAHKANLTYLTLVGEISEISGEACPPLLQGLPVRIDLTPEAQVDEEQIERVWALMGAPVDPEVHHALH